MNARNEQASARGEHTFFIGQNETEGEAGPMGGKSITVKVDSSSEDIKVGLFVGERVVGSTKFINAGNTHKYENVDSANVVAKIKKMTNDHGGTVSGVCVTED